MVNEAKLGPSDRERGSTNQPPSPRSWAKKGSYTMEMGLFSLETTIKVHEAYPWKTPKKRKDN